MLPAIATSDRTTFTATTRNPRHVLRIAWNRDVDSSIVFGLVGTSIVGGKDIVQGTQTVLTKPDLFKYSVESHNVLKIETERTLEEPLGGIAFAQADFTLNNTHLRYTPNINATVGTALIPNRPCKIYLGLKVSDTDKAVPNFYGLTDMPRENKTGRTVEIHAFDFLKFIDNFILKSTIYTDQRSDQIIKDILLNKLGFGSSQFVLATGLNLIKFAWFPKGTTAGKAIRMICEAEEATFYQDETGMLKFDNRRKAREAPWNASVWTINPEDIILWEEDQNPTIINRCIVKAEPRSVQPTQEIWRDGTTEEVPGNGTLIVEAHFDDPISSLTTPEAGNDYIANTFSDFSGTVITDDISIATENLAQDVILTITNSNSGVAFVNLKLRGTPAQVTSKIIERYEDEASVSTYDIQELVIENDFIVDASFAHYLAKTIVNKYKTPRKRLILTVPAIPTLQLRDIVTVKDNDQGTTKDYRVMRIQSNMFPSQYTQRLTLREVFTGETDAWAVVGSTTVDDIDEFVGN